MPPPVPLVTGAGQITDRAADPSQGLEPLALMDAAARRALDDAGVARTAWSGIDTLAVVTNVFHDYGDTATMLASRLGLRPRRSLLSTWGGNTPQSLVNHLCDEIAAGRVDVALLVGGEAFHTMRALGKAGLPISWTPPAEVGAPRWGDPRPGTSDAESRHGLREAYVTFALYENAFRAARGQSIAQQRAELGAFAERCARVAAVNRYAWFRDAKHATALVTVGPENRMVAFPYPKYLNAIMEVNQGAALLLSSEAAARRLGIPEARWVWPWTGVDASELWFLTERADYRELPALRRAGAALLEEVDLPVQDFRYLDLYGCFPIAPRLTAAMLGLDPATPRPLTVTGALPWFGGPGNNYATHAIASVVERLRADREGTALVHAVGWNFTKHALGVYGGRSRQGGWHRAGDAGLQDELDALPHPTLAEEPAGAGTLETYTVVHGREGAPERGVAIGLLDDGRRFVAMLPSDSALLAAMEDEEQVGRRGTVRTADRRSTFDPG
jgi:acetyl-CoA C-acetyltransferase